MNRPSTGAKVSILVFSATLALYVLLGCNAKPASEDKLRISMIPTTDPGKALRENEPLLAYWQKQTGKTPELTIPTSYAAVVEALANNKVDIAYLGGFTYVQASARTGVRPLVQRTIDQQFQSLFITPADSKIHSLADLHGHFVFGDVNSTSGHLMPLYYMLQGGRSIRKSSRTPATVALTMPRRSRWPTESRGRLHG